MKYLIPLFLIFLSFNTFAQVCQTSTISKGHRQALASGALGFCRADEPSSESEAVCKRGYDFYKANENATGSCVRVPSVSLAKDVVYAEVGAQVQIEVRLNKPALRDMNVDVAGNLVQIAKGQRSGVFSVAAEEGTTSYSLQSLDSDPLVYEAGARTQTIVTAYQSGAPSLNLSAQANGSNLVVSGTLDKPMSNFFARQLSFDVLDLSQNPSPVVQTLVVTVGKGELSFNQSFTVSGVQSGKLVLKASLKKSLASVNEPTFTSGPVTVSMSPAGIQMIGKMPGDDNYHLSIQVATPQSSNRPVLNKMDVYKGGCTDQSIGNRIVSVEQGDPSLVINTNRRTSLAFYGLIPQAANTDSVGVVVTGPEAQTNCIPVSLQRKAIVRVSSMIWNKGVGELQFGFDVPYNKTLGFDGAFQEDPQGFDNVSLLLNDTFGEAYDNSPGSANFEIFGASHGVQRFVSLPIGSRFLVCPYFMRDEEKQGGMAVVKEGQTLVMDQPNPDVQAQYPCADLGVVSEDGMAIGATLPNNVLPAPPQPTCDDPAQAEASPFHALISHDFSDGQGEVQAYLICNQEEFESMGSGYNFVIGTNLDLSAPMAHLGARQSSFEGKIDGQGYTISNMNYNNPGSISHQHGGLVGICTIDCLIENVNLTNSTVQATNSMGFQMEIGGLAGDVLGQIKNSSVTNTLIKTSTLAGKAGGIAGYLNGTAALIENCSVSGNTVQATGPSSFSGDIVGQNTGGTITPN